MWASLYAAGTAGRELDVLVWHLKLLWRRFRRGILWAQQRDVAPPVKGLKRSTWAVLKRAGLKFPAAFALLPGDDGDKLQGTQFRANRYLGHQFERLGKAAEARNARLFWTISRSLIERSRAYRMAAVHKALPF